MSGYIGTQPVPQATQTRDSFTCTAGQTSFATSGYTPNFLDVYLNGVKLTATDYTASNGSDVVLASGAATGDVLEVVAYTPFEAANVTGATDFTVTGSFTSQGIDDNATSTAMTLDSSGNVGIGTSSPSGNLHVYENSTAGSYIFLENTDGSTRFQANNDSIFIDAETHIFRDSVAGGSGEYMRIASSGNVGIGTSSPDARITVDAGTEATAFKSYWSNGGNLSVFTVEHSSDLVTLNSFNAGDALAFGTTGTERMRIDSSGNLLVGKTSTGYNSGTEISYEDFIRVNRTNGSALYVGRNSSDGELVSFRKDGSTVGSIGTRSAGEIYIGSNDTGIQFNESADNIIPVNTATQAIRDSAIDLGYSSGRFKDLYLSGGVFLGGTGSANKLDDYEEGTWTPSLQNVTASYTSRSGTYTKIGRLVFATMDMDVSSLDTSDASGFTVTLPFAAPTGGDKSALFSASIKYNESNALVPTGNTDFLNSGGKVYGSTMNIRAPYETGGGTDPTYASFNSSGSIIFSIMYFAA